MSYKVSHHNRKYYKSKQWQLYNDKRRIYKKSLRVAQSGSRKDHCETLEKDKDSARLSKILAKGHSNPAYIKKNYQLWTLQKLIDSQIRHCLGTDCLPGCQEAYIKGRSTSPG